MQEIENTPESDIPQEESAEKSLQKPEQAPVDEFKNTAEDQQPKEQSNIDHPTPSEPELQGKQEEKGDLQLTKEARDAALERNEFEEARNTLSSIEDQEMRSIANAGITDSLAKKENFDEALATLRQDPNPESRVMSYGQVAEYQSNAGLKEDSHKTWGEALDAAKDIQDPNAKDEYLISLADNALNLNEASVSRAAIEELSDPFEKAFLLHQLAEKTGDQTLQEQVEKMGYDFSKAQEQTEWYQGSFKSETMSRVKGELLNNLQVINKFPDNLSDQERSLASIQLARELKWLRSYEEAQLALQWAQHYSRQRPESGSLLATLLRIMIDAMLEGISEEQRKER